MKKGSCYNMANTYKNGLVGLPPLTNFMDFIRGAPLPATIEDVTSFIIRVGIKKGYSVIPEFTFPGQSANKKIDIVWAKKRVRHGWRPGSLACWDIAVCFEIEGIDVAQKRILSHLDDFRHIQKVSPGCKCYIVFYDQAFHRKNEWAKPLNQDRKDRVFNFIPKNSKVIVRFSDDYKSIKNERSLSQLA